MKCQIQWIDSDGRPTPDNNEAVAMAHSHEPVWKCPTGCPGNRIVGWTEEIAQSFPICADHLPRLKDLLGKGWSTSPLLDLPQAVTDAVVRHWPDQAARILPTIRHNHDHYYFQRWGMYVGIEYDGYIHT